MKCTFEDCVSPKYAKGYCVKHYQQSRRGILGKVTGSNSTKDRLGSPRERFEKCYEVVENGCWNWKNLRPDGRANGFLLNGKIVGAHVASYTIHKGETNGLWVLHRCDNGLCVNPDHLFLGSPKENTQDMIQKGRQVIKRGEARGKVAKLTEAQVIAIKAAAQSGTSGNSLAIQYGVHRRTVYDILDGKTWTHI